MGSRIAVGIYLFAIIAANLIILQFGPAASIWNAFFLIGLDLTLRDSLHDAWQGKSLWIKMFALICAGSVITVFLNMDAMQIAIASAVAFGFAGFGDALVYQLMRKRIFLFRANGSNLAGSIIDSVLFPTLAFGVFIPEIIIGQFLAKVIGGFLWSIIIVKIRYRIRLTA